MPFHRPIPESKPPAKASGGLAAYIEAEKLMHIAFVLPCGGGHRLGGRLVGRQAAASALDCDCRHRLWHASPGCYYVIQQAIAAEKISRKEDPTQNGTGKGSGRRS